MPKTKEELSQYKKEWREKNRDRVLSYDKERYQNPERKAATLKRASEYSKTDKRKKWKEDNKEKIAIKIREYRQKNKIKARIRTYNLTVEEHDRMYEQQEGQCCICSIHSSELSRPLNVDHCHKTGIVRSLLCQNCNSALGMVGEDILIIENLINYLERV